MVEWN